MIFECLVKNDLIIVAKPKGWVWSEREHNEFEIVDFEIDQKNVREEYDIAYSKGILKASSTLFNLPEFGVIDNG